MSKPNFQAMSQKELHDYVLAHRDDQEALHDYVLAHRDDQEAFYAYVDKLHAEANWIEMPPLESLQDLDKYPEFIERFRGGSNV